MRIRWMSAAISLLIVACGWFSSQSLIRVDKDLRIIYAEYTLAATDLGHVNGELIRYRTSVIRAIEAGNKQDFERIVVSLQHKRARLDQALERFVEASNDASQGKRMDARELTELQAVRKALAAYMTSSQQALEVMEKRWDVGSSAEAHRLQDLALQRVAKDSGAKFNSTTLELDRLLEVVATIASEVNKDAVFTVRSVTTILITASLALGFFVLAMPHKSM